jgi:hypothetical protein
MTFHNQLEFQSNLLDNSNIVGMTNLTTPLWSRILWEFIKFFHGRVLNASLHLQKDRGIFVRRCFLKKIEQLSCGGCA